MNFGQIVVVDFEFEIETGGLPRPLCMVAQVLDEHLQYVRTIRLWRGEFGTEPPFDIGPDTLFVAYTAWAELTCFKVLGWKFPKYIFDCHTAFLAQSNILDEYNPTAVRKKPRKRLSDACRAHGLDGWQSIDKEDISKAIGEGTWVGKYSPEEILAYCTEDVFMTTRLLRSQVRTADASRIMWWSEYSAKAVALIQAKGIPIDVALWNLVQENKAAVVAGLLEQFDPSHFDDDPIFNADGEWSYARFERWLIRAGIPFWPRLESGQLDVDGDAFRLMSGFPGVEGIHALRDSLGFITKARLPIGRDGRNRPSLFPFGTASGRNAHAKSIFNVHAGMRSFIVFPPDKIGCYLDFRTQEVGIAASLSGDSALMADYQGGDVYYGLAKLCGQTNGFNQVDWKKNCPAIRQQMKSLQLAIYRTFWRWREGTMQQAMLDRRMSSIFGWPLHISASPNQRTLFNFPAQSGGADMLRLATMRMIEAGIVPCMLVHDGILFELDNAEQVDVAREIMKSAGKDTCDGLEIGADIDQRLERGARYRDKRPVAIAMWDTLGRALDKALAGAPAWRQGNSFAA